MDIFIVELMVVFVAAVVLGMVFRFFKLPSLVGQVVAGFIIGATGIIGHQSVDALKIFSTLGVTLLLFLIGLEMNWQEVKHSAKTVFKLFIIQTILLSVIFWAFSFFILRLNMISSAMLSIALTFSSTIVVVKSLSEGKDLSSFVGRLSLGILLLQDLLAIVLLALIPGFKDGLSVSSLEILVAKILLILFVVNLVGHYVISWLMKYFVKSTEDLVLFSLVWFFLSVYFSTNVLKLTPEIGGILAGISLSSSWGHFQIVSKVKTLRDIFLTIFFVLLGLEVGVEPVNWLLVLYIVAMILSVKFLVSGFAALFGGLKRRVAFAVGLNMTQISEFSLIVLTIGLSASLWGKDLVSAVTVSGLISMVLSTILISNSSKLYKSFSRKFPKLFSNERRDGKAVSMSGHIILLGGDRTGRSILSFLKKNRELVLIVDFNPEIIKRLKVKGEEAIFADASDPDVIELTNMVEAKMVISTVKDIHDSLALLTEMRLKGIKVPAIVDAESASQAAELYEAGAAYVIFPHFVSGLHLGQLMRKFEKDSDTLNHYRLRQNETLKEIYEGEF